MSAANRIAYDWAVLRVVPHPWTGTFVPVGVLVHARTAGFLGLRVVRGVDQLARRVPDVDLALLDKYLASIEAIAKGDVGAGPVALAPTSERFHWLTAPRSDVLQAGPVRTGVCTDPSAALEELFESFVS